MSNADTLVQQRQADSSPGHRPSRGRFLVAALLSIVGVAGAVMWFFAVETGVYGYYQGFLRGSVSSVLALQAHPGTYWVYAEGDPTLRDIQVTGPTGAVPVTMTSPHFVGYLYGGNAVYQVGKFTVSPAGTADYQVSVTPGAGSEVRNVAVSDFDIVLFERTQYAGMAVLLFVNLGSSVAIVVAPMVMQRRRRTA